MTCSGVILKSRSPMIQAVECTIPSLITNGTGTPLMKGQQAAWTTPARLHEIAAPCARFAGDPLRAYRGYIRLGTSTLKRFRNECRYTFPDEYEGPEHPCSTSGRYGLRRPST